MSSISRRNTRRIVPYCDAFTCLTYGLSKRIPFFPEPAVTASLHRYSVPPTAVVAVTCACIHGIVKLDIITVLHKSTHTSPVLAGCTYYRQRTILLRHTFPPPFNFCLNRLYGSIHLHYSTLSFFDPAA